MSISPVASRVIPDNVPNKVDEIAHNPVLNHNYVTRAELQEAIDHFNRYPDEQTYSPEFSNRTYSVDQYAVEGEAEKKYPQLAIYTEISDPGGVNEPTIKVNRVFQDSDGKLRLSPEASVPINIKLRDFS
jgi:hypothetical protein